MSSATATALSADDEVPKPTSSSADDNGKVRNALKTALSLTLAYLIPMAMGWPQPQTAAITVMLIAATGVVSESLQKGIARILGTVAGAIIGLSLIALFPQDRALYLVVVSITVAVVMYLYNAYQADGTVFMLTAVVILMVFNGGDAEGAFLYGIDRAFMTVLGVVVYTLVATFLWPVRTADNTRALAVRNSQHYWGLYSSMRRQSDDPAVQADPAIAHIVADGTALKEQFERVSAATGMVEYQAEWNAVLSCYEDVQNLLFPALRDACSEQLLRHYLVNYDALADDIDARFSRIMALWRAEKVARVSEPQQIEYNAQAMRDASHLTVAQVVGRADLLRKLQVVLADLDHALQSMILDKGDFQSQREPIKRPKFVWWDRENFNTAVRALVCFWVATPIWILFNPPGGFMFVTLCTIFIPLLSYTPVTPKLLMTLLTVSFIVAVPVYVFLLPLLTHWLELAAFIFVYAFIGLFLFPGPAAIFFLLGLFILGIQNDMNYHFDVIALIILMFYMVSATLVIALYFPFSGRPERVYVNLQRRFYAYCGKILAKDLSPRGEMAMIHGGEVLLTKMEFWGSNIDTVYFNKVDPNHVCAHNQACKMLLAELRVFVQRDSVSPYNPVVAGADDDSARSLFVGLCEALASGRSMDAFGQLPEQLKTLEETLDRVLGDEVRRPYDRHQLAQFYVYLNVQKSLLKSIENCHTSQRAVDWPQLAEPRF